MSRKNNRSKIKAQYEVEVQKEKERKEKLQMKRERKAKKAQTTEKKVSNKVLRRMKLRQQQQDNSTNAEKMETS